MAEHRTKKRRRRLAEKSSPKQDSKIRTYSIDEADVPPAEAPAKSRAKGGGLLLAPQTRTSNRKIGELLIEASAVSRSDLEAALKFQADRGGKLGDALVRIGCISRNGIENVLAQLPGIASIDLSNCNIEEKTASVLYREFAVEHEVFPLARLGNFLTLAMAYPLDGQTIAKVEEMTGLKVRTLLCRSEHIKRAANRWCPPLPVTEEAKPAPKKPPVLAPVQYSDTVPIVAHTAHISYMGAMRFGRRTTLNRRDPLSAVRDYFTECVETAARGVERRIKLRDVLIVIDAEEAPFCFEETELEISAEKVQLIYAAHDIQDESEWQDEGPAPSDGDGLETHLLLQDGKRISGRIQLRKGENRYTAVKNAFIALAWAEIESFSPHYQSFHTKSVLVNRAYIESFAFRGGRED